MLLSLINYYKKHEESYGKQLKYLSTQTSLFSNTGVGLVAGILISLACTVFFLIKVIDSLNKGFTKDDIASPAFFLSGVILEVVLTISIILKHKQNVKNYENYLNNINKKVETVNAAKKFLEAHKKIEPAEIDNDPFDDTVNQLS